MESEVNVSVVEHAGLDVANTDPIRLREWKGKVPAVEQVMASKGSSSGD